MYFKKDDSIVSDHVEIWLADPALSRTQIRSLNNLRDFRSRLQEKLQRKGEPDDYYVVVRKNIKDVQNLIHQYEDQSYYTQLVFNNQRLLTIPSEVNKEGIKFEYRNNKDGYIFYAEIPLNGVIDYKSNQINNISFMIDVIDVDDENASSQKSLISTSNKRVFRHPDTFNMLKLPEKFQFSINPIDEVKMKLAPEGFYHFSNNQYIYYREQDFIYIGWYGPERDILPGYYSPFELNDCSKESSYRLYLYGGTAIIEKDGTFHLLNLYEYSKAEGGYILEPMFQNQRNGFCYLLFNVIGCTRWPPGSCMGGAAYEGNLVWLKLDSSFTIEASKSIVYMSYWNNSMGEPQVKGQCVQVDYTEDEVNKTAIYDNKKPERGIQVFEKK